MKKVYTLTDLANETGIRTNGYQAFLKDGTVIGLYEDMFSITKPNHETFRLSPSQIIPYIKCPTIANTFSLSDSDFFDHCKKQFQLSEDDEEEFFELDLDDSPLENLNKWLTSKKIPYKITLCEAVSDVNYWVTADTK